MDRYDLYKELFDAFWGKLLELGRSPVPGEFDRLAEVKKAGGKILGSMDQNGKHTLEPQMIPGVGLWVSIEDTEGNRVSILQAGA